jgi:hypothetical protein
MANNDQPTDANVHTVAILSVLDRWQCSFPGIVAQVADLEGRVLVQPAIRIPARNGQQVTPRPVLIPVAWPSWGVYGFQGVLAVGDEVLVRCQDKNWLAWLVTGGQVDDVAIGGHQSGYAVAEPVQLSKPRRLPPLPTGTALRIGTKDGSTTVVFGVDGSISVQSGNVRLGAAATAPALAVARDTDAVDTNVAFTTWRTNVEAGVLAGGGGVVPPLVGTAIGTVDASSTEVTST